MTLFNDAALISRTVKNIYFKNYRAHNYKVKFFKKFTLGLH